MVRFWQLAQFISGEKLPGTGADQSSLDRIFDIFFVIIGASAVLLFVIAGFRYVLSQGDPTKIAESKMRLFHIAIGLVVVALAIAIVNFILDRFG